MSRSRRRDAGLAATEAANAPARQLTEPADLDRAQRAFRRPESPAFVCRIPLGGWGVVHLTLRACAQNRHEA